MIFVFLNNLPKSKRKKQNKKLKREKNDFCFPKYSPKIKKGETKQEIKKGKNDFCFPKYFLPNHPPKISYTPSVWVYL